MPDRILVTYASRAGSTRGVAEAIGKTLAECGEQVDVLRMQDVKDLAPYRAVVAGSAIQGRQWLPEAMQFMQTHRATLDPEALRRVLGVHDAGDAEAADKYRAHVRRLPAGQDPHAGCRPVSEGIFAGALDISKIPSFGDRLKFRLSVLFGVWTEGDHRDWNAIRAWAESIHPLLLR